MAAIDHVDQRADPLPRIILQPHRSLHLAIYRSDLLALAKIGDGRSSVALCDPKGDATARAAPIEAEHQAGLLRCAAMDKRVDAESAVLTDQACRNPFDEFEARPPHQGAVAEDPKVTSGEFRVVERNAGHIAHR